MLNKPKVIPDLKLLINVPFTINFYMQKPMVEVIIMFLDKFINSFSFTLLFFFSSFKALL